MSDDADDFPAGQPIAYDADAISAVDGMAGFLAPPPGSPAYYGFAILPEIEFDGFRFGMITDFIAQPDDDGDAFIVAPDDSRAGVMWYANSGPVDVQPAVRMSSSRWGVWHVHVPFEMRSVADAQRLLEVAVPLLRPEWQLWKRLMRRPWILRPRAFRRE